MSLEQKMKINKTIYSTRALHDTGAETVDLKTQGGPPTLRLRLGEVTETVCKHSIHSDRLRGHSRACTLKCPRSLSGTGFPSFKI